MIGVDNDRQVFFYERDFYVFSNFSAFRLEWRGFDFDTSEHAYQWSKFYGSSGPESGILRTIAQEIRVARSAHDAFKIAEKFKNNQRHNWNDLKLGVMFSILRCKADQHEYVRRKLLQTGDRELIEDSWRDDFWGWGPNRDGQNHLGKLWMKVREELIKEATNEH